MSPFAAAIESQKYPSPRDQDEYLAWHAYRSATFHLDGDISQKVANEFRRLTEAMAADLLEAAIREPTAEGSGPTDAPTPDGPPAGTPGPRSARPAIRVVVNSPGGSVNAAFDMISQVRRLQRLGIDVEAEIVGQASSMAAVLAAAATRCRMSSLGALMWHGIFLPDVHGDINGIVAQSDQMESMAERIATILLTRARRTPNGKRSRFARRAWVEKMLRDTTQVWIYPDEALANGLVDGILD